MPAADPEKHHTVTSAIGRASRVGEGLRQRWVVQVWRVEVKTKTVSQPTS